MPYYVGDRNRDTDLENYSSASRGVADGSDKKVQQTHREGGVRLHWLSLCWHLGG